MVEHYHQLVVIIVVSWKWIEIPFLTSQLDSQHGLSRLHVLHVHHRQNIDRI